MLRNSKVQHNEISAAEQEGNDAFAEVCCPGNIHGVFFRRKGRKVPLCDWLLSSLTRWTEEGGVKRWSHGGSHQVRFAKWKNAHPQECDIRFITGSKIIFRRATRPEGASAEKKKVEAIELGITNDFAAALCSLEGCSMVGRRVCLIKRQLLSDVVLESGIWIHIQVWL